MLVVDEREYYAQKIKEQFGDVKIILGIRDPESHIQSLYSEYLCGGGVERFKVWKRSFLNWRYLEVNNYIKLLNDSFSEVFIYEYELLSRDKTRFMSLLCDFLECQVPDYQDVVHRKGLNKWNRNYVWLRNRFFTH
jgi:hypothetical protein